MKTNLITLLAFFISTSIFATDLIVDKVGGDATYEGTYIENGIYNEKPIYFHQNTNYVIGFNNSFAMWVIGMYDETNGITTFDDYVFSDTPTPPSTGWAISTVKLSQSIVFDPVPEGLTYGDSDIPLNASASSGLPVTFSSSNTSIANIINGTLQIEAPGTCTIYATQMGNDDYVKTTAEQTVTISFDATDLNIQITNIASTSATVSWSSITNSNSYEINIIKTSDGSTISTNQTETTSTTLFGLEASTDYTIYIFPVINGVLATHESPTSHSTPESPQMEASNLTVDSYTSNTATVSWDGAGANKYIILYNEQGTTNFQYVSSTASPKTLILSAATTYEFRIKTIIGEESSQYTDATIATTLDGENALASNLTVDSYTESTATLSWDGSGAGKYLIRYNVKGTTNYQYASSTTSPKTLLLTPATTYECQIRTEIDGATSSYTDIIEFTTLEGQQIVASNLTVDSYTESTATLSWDGSGAGKYLIRYNVKGTTNYQYASSTTSPKTLLLTPATTYECQIRTEIDGATSSYTDIIGFTTLEGQQIVASNLAVDNYTESIATLSWNETGADRYTIRYNVKGTTSYQYASSSTSPKTLILSPATTYECQIRTEIDGAISSYTDVIEFTMLEGEEAAASNLNVDSYTESTATLSWNETGADRYIIKYNVKGTTNYQYASSATSPKMLILTPSTTYECQIKTEIDGATSSYTDLIEFTTLAGQQNVASNLTVDSYTESTATLNWDGTGADMYAIRYYISGTTNNNWLFSKSYPKTITGLTPNTTYECDIKTMIGDARYISSPISFTTSSSGEIKSFEESIAESEDDNENSLSLVTEFKVYPNPAIDKVCIEFDGSDDAVSTIEITDIQGKTVKRRQMETTQGLNEVKIELLDIQRGIYYIKITNSNHSFVKKLIIQ